MPQNYIPYIVMAVAIIFMIRRNLRSRRIRAETLWVFPVILLAIAGLTVAQNPPHDATGVAILAAGAVGGAVAGWYRGKFTHISLDAETGELTGKGSAIGLIIILGLLVARYAIRTWATTHPDKGGIAIAVADAAFLFGFATLIVSRLEMWLRCRKLMAASTPAA
jgi:membrane protein CcdC involved in cytochrome C biogenesis